MAVVELSDDEPSPWLSRAQVPGGPSLARTTRRRSRSQLVAKRFKSSSAGVLRFIHDPLGVLIDAQGAGDIFQDVELTSEWKVTTHVVNHHRTLKARHLYALVSANDDEKTVGVQLKLQAEA